MNEKHKPRRVEPLVLRPGTRFMTQGSNWGVYRRWVVADSGGVVYEGTDVVVNGCICTRFADIDDTGPTPAVPDLACPEHGVAATGDGE